MQYCSDDLNKPVFWLGEKIKQRRKHLKMTQKDLAGLLGVTFQQVQKYEKGISNITMPTFINICRGLKVHPNYFMDSISLQEAEIDVGVDLEKKLLSIFRSIEDENVKARILELVNAVALIQTS